MNDEAKETQETKWESRFRLPMLTARDEDNVDEVSRDTLDELRFA